MSGGHQGTHTWWRRDTHPWPRGHVVWASWSPTDVALLPIYSIPREIPKYPVKIPRKVPPPPPSSTLDQEGSEAILGTLPEKEIITGCLFITMPDSGVMRE